jgi:putative membrane protein
VRLLLRFLITAIALGVTVWLLPGIHIEGPNSVLAVVVTAVILGVVNAFVRPILTLLSCGLVVITLGLFLLVINALMLALASWIAVNWFGIGFYIDNFWWALLGSIVISIVSFILSMVLPDERRVAA